MNIIKDELFRLWKTYKVSHEMVHDRGFLVSQRELEMTFDDFKSVFASSGQIDRDQLTYVVQHKDNPTDQLLVFFPKDPTVGVKPLSTYLERMAEQRINHGICIYQKNLTPYAKRAFKALSDRFSLQEFHESELMVNVTHHSLVPKHEILNSEEKASLLRKYRLKETQLPRIQYGDPIARYYGLKQGQVVRVIRYSETAGRYASYRLCT